MWRESNRIRIVSAWEHADLVPLGISTFGLAQLPNSAAIFARNARRLERIRAILKRWTEQGNDCRDYPDWNKSLKNSSWDV